MKNNLLLPCLTGKFGSWRFYNVIMKVKDLVDPINGVKTVPQAKKIYRSDNLNEILQRLEDPKRIEPLKNYILKQKDRYFNSLTVAIAGGDPKWYPVSIRKDLKFNDGDIEYLNLKFGLLELSGNEELFILDGQHRLLGLRAAVSEKTEAGEEEISVMLVNHEETVEGIKKTRRIFVALNRNAKPVSEGENIILEEDDVSAILARLLVERYSVFKSKNVIAFNKNLNLKPGKNDLDKFTSLLALYSINEILIDHEKLYGPKVENKYIKIRPSDKLIEEQYGIVVSFWDSFFSTFPLAKTFINDTKKNSPLKTQKGGLFYLRPIGQEILALLYQDLYLNKNKADFRKLKKVEKYLESDFWNYILYNPYSGKVLMNKGSALTYLKYNLGLSVAENKLEQLKNTYKNNSGELQLILPEPLYAVKE